MQLIMMNVIVLPTDTLGPGSAPGPKFTEVRLVTPGPAPTFCVLPMPS